MATQTGRQQKRRTSAFFVACDQAIRSPEALLEKYPRHGASKSGREALPGRQPSAIISRFRGYGFCHILGSVAQLVEQRTFNPLVASSNLARPTRFKKSHGSPWLFLCAGLSAGKVTKNVSSCLIRAGARIGGLHSRYPLLGG